MYDGIDLCPDTPAGAHVDAKGCPIESEVTHDGVVVLFEKSSFRLPFVPPALDNHGNVIVSLGELSKWLAAQAEERGVRIATETPAEIALSILAEVIKVRRGGEAASLSGH